MSSESPAATSPVCPTHPASPSVGTCNRCGRFVCGACVHEVDPLLCVDCHARTAKPAKELKPGFDLNMVLFLITLPWNVYEFLTDVFSTPVGPRNQDIGWDEVPTEPRWMVLAAVHLVGTAIIAVLSAWILPRYLRKKRDVPRLMRVLFVVFGAHFLIINGLRHWLTPETAGAWWAIPIVLVFVWLIFQYFDKNPKVKVTFVN